jgi:hypothetical protein
METDENIKQFFDNQANEYIAVPNVKIYTDAGGMIPTGPNVLFGSLFLTREEVIFSDESSHTSWYSTLAAGGFPLAGAVVGAVQAGASLLTKHNKSAVTVEQLKKRKFSASLPYSSIIGVFHTPVRLPLTSEDAEFHIIAHDSVPKDRGQIIDATYKKYTGFSFEGCGPIRVDKLSPGSEVLSAQLHVPKEIKKGWKLQKINKLDGINSYVKGVEKIFRMCISHSSS